MLTSGGTCLPHGMSGNYLDYKRTTKIAIKWLQDNGAITEEDRTTTTCNGLLRLAENIRVKGIKAPRDIAWALRDAIERRRHLNSWMREQENLNIADKESNLRHEIFVETLETVYDSLRLVGIEPSTPQSKPRISTTTSASTSSGSDSPEPLLNRFDPLYDDSESDDDPSTPTQSDQEAPSIALPEPKKSNTPIKPKHVVDFDLMDVMEDMVSKIGEAIYALMNLDSYLVIIKNVWAQAGRGEIPYAVATVVTKSVWSWSTEDMNILSTVPFTHDIKLFQLITKTLKHGRRPPGWLKTDLPPTMDCSHGDGLIIPLHVVDSYVRKPWHPKKMPQFKEALAKIPSKANRGGDARAMLLLLQCMLEYEVIDQYDHNGSPELLMTQDWVAGGNLARDRLKVAFHLRILLEAHRSYMYPDGQTPVAASSSIAATLNPRLRLLKYVVEVQTSFIELYKNPYMEHCCSRSLSGTLKLGARDMEDMIKEPHYDLYFQNPVVSGNIAIKLYGYVRDVGRDIMNHRHYVASILHVYNALCCMGSIDPVPVLDELCSLFEDIIFLGNRPKRNFSSIFTRHRGGLPQYTEYAGIRGHDLGSNSTWAMRVPDRDVVDSEGNTEHEEINSKRFEESVDQSVFHSTCIEGTEVLDYYWAQLLGQRRWYNPTDADRTGIVNWLQSHNLNNHPISYIKGILIKEYRGSPIPTVDLTSIPAYQPSIESEPMPCTRSMCTMAPSKAHRQPDRHTVAETALPSIRLIPGRPGCSCHKNTSRSRVLAKERVRGTGLLPVMRLNYGAIWLACADAFEKVNKSSKHKVADGADIGIEGEDPATCLCTVDQFLMNSDIYINREKKSMKFPSPKLLKKWIKSIESTFREKKADDFLFQWF